MASPTAPNRPLDRGGRNGRCRGCRLIISYSTPSRAKGLAMTYSAADLSGWRRTRPIPTTVPLPKWLRILRYEFGRHNALPLKRLIILASFCQTIVVNTVFSCNL